ncbi:MAG: hypothetical protein Q7S87_03205 [Agitococcus sp.]|nr:hypothetical protein [Agitococcus sp.]
MLTKSLPSLTFEKVSLADARLILHPLELAAPTLQLRGTPPSSSLKLTGNAARWVVGLPAFVRPLALARKYPRVANALAEAWGNASKFEAQLDSYLIDDRGNRLGFPVEVAKDLMDLKAYFDQQRLTTKVERRIVMTPTDGMPPTNRPAPSVYQGTNN